MRWLITPFTRIGGSQVLTPLQLSIVQTDGSYTSKSKGKGKIAVYMNKQGSVKQNTGFSSTEMEWASIVFGLQYALENNKDKIGIENDNMGVVHFLENPDIRLKHEYANHYRNEIQMLAGYTEWTGIHWIPRELNKADDLFH